MERTVRSILCVQSALGCLLACGSVGSVASALKTPDEAASGSADVYAAREVSPRPAPAPRVLASAPPTAENSRPATAADAASDELSFGSGLVVDQRLVGGPAPGPELPKGSRVLHIGDSFAGALGIELNKVLISAGVSGRLEFEQSTYIPTWAHSNKLAGILESFKPELIIISLGANELEIPEPEKRAPLVQKLVKSLGNTPCVWVAPVLWEGAKANLLEIIRANVGSCVYLDSNQLIKRMPRARDKIHPSMASRPDWATVTARWLAYHRKPTANQVWALLPQP